MANVYEYPKYYEIVFGSRNFKRECDFITELIKKFSKINTSVILDIACGTGPHMIGLSKLGFKVAGLDSSNKMLVKINKRLKGKPNFIGVYKKDMVSFNIPQKFDACICMVNSLEILTKNEQFISHFHSVANCLKRGGIYIIELDNPSFIFSNPLPGERIKEYKKKIKRGKIKIGVIYKKYPFDLINFLEKNELILDINDNGKKLIIRDSSPVRRLAPLDIDLFVKLSHKFELIKILGDFKLESTINDKNSKRMIVILRKK